MENKGPRPVGVPISATQQAKLNGSLTEQTRQLRNLVWEWVHPNPFETIKMALQPGEVLLAVSQLLAKTAEQMETMGDYLCVCCDIFCEISPNHAAQLTAIRKILRELLHPTQMQQINSQENNNQGTANVEKQTIVEP